MKTLIPILSGYALLAGRRTTSTHCYKNWGLLCGGCLRLFSLPTDLAISVRLSQMLPVQKQITIFLLCKCVASDSKSLTH